MPGLSPSARPSRPDAAGAISVVLTVYPDGEAGHALTLADGTEIPSPGYLLRDLRALLGGDQGALVDPIRGETHPVSLAAWTDADPDTTRVLVAYQLTAPGHQPSPTLPPGALP